MAIPRRRPPDPPSPGRGWPLLGVLPRFHRDPTEYLRKASELGDVVHFKLGPRHGYLVNHPDAIRDILVTHQNNFTKSRMLVRAKILLGEGLLTSEGEFHLRQRRLVQPAFHRDRLAGYAATMVQSAARHRAEWRDGETVDISREMMRLTLAIVGLTLFSADVSSHSGTIGNALTEVFQLLETVMMPFSEWIEKLPIPAVRRFEQARDRLNQIVYGLIAERRSQGGDHGDLLSMLLLAQDEESHVKMTDQQVRDEALTLMLAGHETTSNALTWTWYLLSQNPEVEARLHAELDAVLNGRLPSLDDLSSLGYADAVFSESLRLYPPAWAVGRSPREDYPIGEYVLRAGSVVLLSPWVVQRDPRWYSEPERFYPERWLPGHDGSAGLFARDNRMQPPVAASSGEGNRAGDAGGGSSRRTEQAERPSPALPETRPKFSYFPFGGGARVCIGERFAVMEGVLLLAALAQNWKFRLVPGHRVETKPLITLRPKYGMRMTVESR